MKKGQDQVSSHNTAPDYPELLHLESGILEKKGIYFHSPSEFAREHLFYPFFGATYTCVPPYRVHRAAGEVSWYMFMAVLKGELHIVSELGEEIARSDDVILIDGRQKHFYYVEKETTFQWLFFNGALSPLYCTLLSQKTIVHRSHPQVSLLLDTILNQIRENIYDEHRLSTYLVTVK